MDLSFESARAEDLKTIFDEIVIGSEQGHFNSAYHKTIKGKRNLITMLNASITGISFPVINDENKPLICFGKIFKAFNSKGEYIGFIIIFKSKEITELIIASVFSKFRGNGYGTQICRKFKKMHKKKTLLIRCKEASLGMKKIIQKIGFKQECVDKYGYSSFYFNKK